MSAQVLEFNHPNGFKRSEYEKYLDWWQRSVDATVFQLKEAGIEHTPVKNLKTVRAWKLFLDEHEEHLWSFNKDDLRMRLRKGLSPMQLEAKAKRQAEPLPDNVIRLFG